MSRRRRIVVAMSGGVDSSTAAALLHEAGHEVVGVTLKLYDARGTSASIGGRCCGPRDIEDARITASSLGFAYYVLDESDIFRRTVVDDFLSEYRRGRTPNPCVRCNEHLKFGPLVQFARAIGAEALATGHYARLEPSPAGTRLLRAMDRDKDQSYFLYGVSPADLDFVRFPLGGLAKAQVRATAHRLHLANCDKPDSQQLCFIPDGDHMAFVQKHGGGGHPGEIVDESGHLLGRHTGTHHFTVGQRRGLPPDGKEKRFVLRIEAASGRVVTGPRPSLGRSRMHLADMRWMPAAPQAVSFPCQVQFRHRGGAFSGIATVGADRKHATIVFDAPVEGGAPGQSAVLYDGELVLGGGWIEDAVPTHQALRPSALMARA